MPINLINLAIFIGYFKNVLILDQKSRFFKDLIPLLVLDRLVDMLKSHSYNRRKLARVKTHGLDTCIAGQDGA